MISRMIRWVGAVTHMGMKRNIRGLNGKVEELIDFLSTESPHVICIIIELEPIIVGPN
jgi:hypothetical protein